MASSYLGAGWPLPHHQDPRQEGPGPGVAGITIHVPPGATFNNFGSGSNLSSPGAFLSGVAGTGTGTGTGTAAGHHPAGTAIIHPSGYAPMHHPLLYPPAHLPAHPPPVYAGIGPVHHPVYPAGHSHPHHAGLACPAHRGTHAAGQALLAGQPPPLQSAPPASPASQPAGRYAAKREHRRQRRIEDRRGRMYLRNAEMMQRESQRQQAQAHQQPLPPPPPPPPPPPQELHHPVGHHQVCGCGCIPCNNCQGQPQHPASPPPPPPPPPPSARDDPTCLAAFAHLFDASGVFGFQDLLDARAELLAQVHPPQAAAQSQHQQPPPVGYDVHQSRRAWNEAVERAEAHMRGHYGDVVGAVEWGFLRV